MALTLDELLPMLGDLSAIVAAGEAASKSVPVDASDLVNAATIIKAVIPPLCDLLVKIEAEAKD